MQQMQQQPELATINHQNPGQRSITIPLMSKKLNSVEKYVNSYRINQKNQNDQTRQQKINSTFSNNASRLLYNGKYTPDPHVSLINQNKCYVKFSPLKQQKTEDRLSELDRISIQYQHLKNNLNGSKDPFTSKYTLPLYKRKVSRKPSSPQHREYSHSQIQKQLRKQVLVEDGQRYFADLYMMQKDRASMKQQIQKNRKFQHHEDSKDKHKDHQQFFIEKKSKEAEEKKNKMLKNKGLHWNVYYEMLALSKNEKQRIKDSNSSFVNTFGIN